MTTSVGGRGALALRSVSAIVLSYNCEAFIADALRSALNQDYVGPMEVLVSDDGSTDGTVEIVRRELAAYEGRHRVRLNRRASNSGSKSAHLNDVFPLCTGEILVSFDGDDVAEPSRVTRIVERFGDGAAVQAVYSSYSFIDSAGRRRGRRRLAQPERDAPAAASFAPADAHAPGATLAVARAVIERFGPLPPEIHEDVVLPFRAGLLGRVELIDEPLVRVRRHAGSFTADYERLVSVESYRARMKKGIARARRAAACRLQDIAAAVEMMPSRRAELEPLRDVVLRSLHAAETSAGLVDGSLAVRTAAFLRLLKTGAYRQELLQHACLALAPQLYLAYKRYRLGLNRRLSPPGRA